LLNWNGLTAIVAVGLKATLKYIVSPFDIPPFMHIQLTIRDMVPVTSTENEHWSNRVLG
jgi:hypothetical protein